MACEIADTGAALAAALPVLMIGHAVRIIASALMAVILIRFDVYERE
ncbi:hypothetical protein [Paenibacillus sp. RU5A]|nr:hypothetical protein [Paenibacillus sp. RU5A]